MRKVWRVGLAAITVGTAYSVIKVKHSAGHRDFDKGALAAMAMVSVRRGALNKVLAGETETTPNVVSVQISPFPECEAVPRTV
jgi:hypothetical protein